jgi:hypothetical protein
MIQEENVTGINWDRFTTSYISVEPGTKKKLVLTKWREDNQFERPGIAFTVIQEDDQDVEKTFVTRSRRLLGKLIPMLQKAEESGKSKITVSILRIGEGFETSYVVKELD